MTSSGKVLFERLSTLWPGADLYPRKLRGSHRNLGWLGGFLGTGRIKLGWMDGACFMCLCVSEREREREKGRESKRREIERLVRREGERRAGGGVGRLGEGGGGRTHRD